MKKSRHTTFAILLGLVVAAIIGLLLSRSSNFHIVKTTPGLGGDIATSTGVIKVAFNQDLAKANYAERVEGKNSSVVKDIQVKDKSLLIYLGTLTEKQTYEFRVPRVKSTKGEMVTISAKFRAKYIPFDQLSKDQRELETSQTDRKTYSNPLLEYLPHQGDRFYLSGEYTQDEETGESIFVVNAQIFLYRADLGNNRPAAIANLKQQVAEFIRSKNLNPDQYLIRYIINEPPATPN